jgi:hypothetical protein
MKSGACGTNGGNVRAVILWGNLRDRGYLEYTGNHSSVTSKLMLKKWAGLVWHRAGTGGGLL